MSMYIGYYVEPTNKLHESIVEGTQVICNYIHCTYIENFDSIEDAKEAAEIHQESNE